MPPQHHNKHDHPNHLNGLHHHHDDLQSDSILNRPQCMRTIRLVCSIVISIFIYFAFISEYNLLEHQHHTFILQNTQSKDDLHQDGTSTTTTVGTKFQVTKGAYGVDASSNVGDVTQQQKLENENNRLSYNKIPLGLSSSGMLGEDPENDGGDSFLKKAIEDDEPEDISEEDKAGALYQYFSASLYPYQLTLLKWDAGGRLERTSPIDNSHWFPMKAQAMFDYIEPSKYGTVALLLNTNVINGIDWKIIPPVPLLVYTMPKSNKGITNFHLVPHPYDRDGYSRACIWHAEQVETPFEDRKPVILWRGTPHGLSSRMKLLHMSEKHAWLDAIDISKNESAKMERPEMAEHKYQLDIGGESGTAWASLRWKMCSGNLVFKVDSWSQDWWFDTIEPWKHYIPVKKDLSDLQQQYEWVEKNPTKVMAIVKAGVEACKKSIGEDTIEAYVRNVLQELPESKPDIMEEATKLLNGLGKFWKQIPASTAFNRTAMEEIDNEDAMNEDSESTPATPLRKKVLSPLIPLDSNPSTSIVRYLEVSRHPHMISILKWNSSGMLERMSPIDQPDWFPEEAVELFARTNPSHYGSVAFLVNTDILSAVPWHIIPPIPLLTYTLPTKCLDMETNEADHDKKFMIIPNPYDRDWDFNRECIKHAETITSVIPFEQRKNIMIWRGVPHGKSDRKLRLQLCELSKRDYNKTWLDAANIEEDRENMYMQRDEMSGYKYQIDVGGESGTTWGSLRWKMCSGNLVFKVDTWSVDWWHNTIEPWEHYIPVKSDLSDLRKQYEWAESHPKEVAEIVRKATETCKESATEEAVVTYQKHIMRTLPRSSEAHIKEADAVLDGLGSFYQPIIDRDG